MALRATERRQKGRESVLELEPPWVDERKYQYIGQFGLFMVKNMYENI